MKGINPDGIRCDAEAAYFAGQQHFADVYGQFISQFRNALHLMKVGEVLMGVRWLHSSQCTPRELEQLRRGEKSHMAPRFFLALARVNQAVAANEKLPQRLGSLALIQPLLNESGAPASAPDLWAAYVGLGRLTVSPGLDPATKELAARAEALSPCQRAKLLSLLETADGR